MRRREPVCIVGTRALRDFHAALCAANLERAGRRGARGRGRARASTAPTPTRSGSRGASTTPTFRAAFAARARAAAARRRARRAAGGARPARPARRVGRPAAAPRAAPCSRSRRCRRRCPACASSRRCARRCARAGGRLVLGVGGRSAPSATAGASPRCAPTPPATTSATARAGSCSPRAGSPRARSRSDSDWITRETVLGLPLRGVPAPGRAALRAATTSPSSRWRASGVAVDGALRAEGAENVLVAGAALPGAVPWREGSGEGIALASGHRAAEVGARRGRDRRRRRHERGACSTSSCAARSTTA